MTARPTAPPSPPTPAGQSLGAMPCYASSCGRVTLYLGDCLDVLPLLSGIDSVVTDPPYGTGKYELDDDAPVVESLKQWKRKAVFGYPEILCGWCILLGKPDEWVTWWPTNKATGRGNRLPKETECVAIWGKLHEMPRRPRRGDAWMKKYVADRGMDTETAMEGDVWRDPSPGLRSNSHLRKHPNEKPETVMMRLARLCAAEGETILDPYMGSGTTGIACIRTGRRFVGIEKDPAHYATALERIKNELAQGDLFLGHNSVICKPSE